MALRVLCVVLAAGGAAASSRVHPATPARPYLIGNVSAVYDMLERVLPGSSSHFALSLALGCAGTASPYCFAVSDAPGGLVAVVGTSASELSAGVGTYLREVCNMTFGWPRGGGSNVFTPSSWPAVGPAPITRGRLTPMSYIMNVCTHSYSLVWYDWPAWEAFIDWMVRQCGPRQRGAAAARVCARRGVGRAGRRGGAQRDARVCARPVGVLCCGFVW